MAWRLTIGTVVFELHVEGCSQDGTGTHTCQVLPLPLRLLLPIEYAESGVGLE